MEYRIDTFDGAEKKVPEYPQYHCIVSPFYDILVPLEADLNAKEKPILLKDQANAFLERLKIYRNKVLKEQSYPVFGPMGVYPGKPTSFECFRQFMCFPFEKVFRKKGGDEANGWLGRDYRYLFELPKEVDEYFIDKLEKCFIADRTRLGLRENIAEEEIAPEILQENRPCVYQLINYLAGKGILFPNIEKLLSDETESFPDYPVFLDPEIAPKEFLAKIDPVELFIAFRIPDTDLEPSEFQKYCVLVENMSPEHAFRFAFQNESRSEEYIQMARIFLRNYFSALLKPIVNDFFFREYHAEKLFPTTVLDHDSRFYPLAMRHFYFGSNFVMAAKVTLVPHKASYEAGTLGLGSEKVGPYRLSTKDRKAVALAFDTVKAYFKAEGKTIYPALFVRQMGLPFPAYEKVAYFDFEEGDGESFADLLDYQDFDVFSMAFPTFALADYGEIQFSEPEDSSSVHYMLARHGVYFLFENIVPYQLNYTIGLDKDGKTFYPFEEDNGEFVSREFEAVEQATADMKKTVPPCESFFVRDGKGNYPQIHEFFLRLQNGEFSMDILRSLFGSDDMNLCAINIFLYNLLGRYCLEKNEKLHKEFLDKCMTHPLAVVERMPIVFDDGKVAAIMGCYNEFFLFPEGLASSEDRYYPVHMYAEKIYDRYFAKEGGFYAAIPFFQEEENRWIRSPYAKAMFVTGLDEKTVRSMDFDYDKAIYSQLTLGMRFPIREQHDRFRAAKWVTPSLLYCHVHKKLLMKSIYVAGEGKAPAPIITARLGSPASVFVDGEFYTRELARIRYPYPIDHEKETGSLFLFRQADAITGEVMYEEFPWESAEYVVNVNRAIIRSAYFDESEDPFIYENEWNDALPIVTLEDAIYTTIHDNVRPLPTAQAPWFPDYDGNFKRNYYSAGRFLYVYSMHETEGPFRYRKEDEESLKLLKKTIAKLPKVAAEKEMDQLLKKCYLNEPLVMQEPYNEFLNEDDHTTFGTFPEVRFASGCTDSLFYLTPVHRDPFRSTYLRGKALKEGYILFTDRNIVSKEMLDVQRLAGNLAASYRELEDFLIYLDERNDKSLNAQIFHPKKRFFETLVEEFIHDYAQTPLSSDFLFYGREALDYLYGKDPKFLSKAVRAIHFRGDFHERMEKSLKDFSIPEIETIFPKDFVHDFIALFVLKVEQEFLIRLWARENVRKEK